MKAWNLYQKEYVGFLTFGEFFCGSDFLSAIDDSRLRIDFVDKHHVYQYDGVTAYKEADNGYAKKALQFM